MSRSQAIGLLKSRGYKIANFRRFMSCGVDPVWDCLVKGKDESGRPFQEQILVYRTDGRVKSLGSFLLVD